MYPDRDIIAQLLPARRLYLFGFAMIIQGKVSIYNKTLNVWSLGKLVSLVFPRVMKFPSTSSRETSGLSGKQN